MAGCAFCQILSGQAEASMVYEDEVCAAFMDIYPANPGHVLVVPREHAEAVAKASMQFLDNISLERYKKSQQGGKQ